ncbi:MAG: Asp-tRNA(Asn)/Glu-tRNA(Gln) amidotransferase subunit GatC [Candidatus Ranarchaeia archaeon]
MHFEANEERKVRKWIDQVLDWFRQLDKINDIIQDVPPQMAPILLPPKKPPLKQTLGKEAVLENAPETEDGYIKTARLT